MSTTDSGSADFVKEWSRALASELEYVRTKICGNEVKQIARPRDNIIQDKSTPAQIKRPPCGGLFYLLFFISVELYS